MLFRSFSVYGASAPIGNDGLVSPMHKNALALGGRYDEVGKAFGRARAATGFSLDLRDLARLLPIEASSGPIAAPYGDGEALLAEVARLRSAGEVVIQTLPGEVTECERELVLSNGHWNVRRRMH